MSRAILKKPFIGRPIGSLEYGDEASKYILTLITPQPKTTNQIKEQAKMKYFHKIHHHTVSRILDSLHREGRIRKQLVGKVTIRIK